METLQQILKREGYNDNKIFLYRQNGYWFAYERSAFYLFSICCVDAIFKITNPLDDSVILATFTERKIEDSKNPHLKILELSEDNMILECSITCKGFLYWKEGLLPSSNHIDSRDILMNFAPHYENCTNEN